jgi:hypothetical protein
MMQIELKTGDVSENVYNFAVQSFGSTKEKTLNKIGESQDTLYNAVEYMKVEMQDIVVGAKNEVHDVSVTTKNKISNDLKYSNDKVYNNVKRFNNAILDDVQLGHDKMNKDIDDAYGKTKVTEDGFASNIKGVGHGIFEEKKGITCETMACLQEQAQEAKSFLPNLCHRVESAYNHKITNGGENIETLREPSTLVNENVAQMEKNDEKWKKNGENSVTKSTQFDGAMKDEGDTHYQEGKKHTTEDYHPKVGRHYKDIQDYYGRSNDYYKGKGGRHNHESVRDVPFKSYFDNAKGESEDYYDGIKDNTRYILKGAKNGEEDYYDNMRDRTSGDFHDQYEGGSKNYHFIQRKKPANGFRNAHDLVEDHYDSKFKPGFLAEVIESMGWCRIGIVPLNHVLSSSENEVVIGNVKYAWHGKDQRLSQETHVNRMSNTIKVASHNIGEKVDLIKEHEKERVENVQDADIHPKGQIQRSFQANKSPERGRLRIDRQLKDHEYEYENNDKDDDPYESKGGEFVEMTRQQFSRFMKYKNDKENEEIGSWGDVLFKRPKGLLLSLIRVLHLFAFSTVYGSSFWMTFVSGIILSKHIPQQQFGYVQSKMFPVYLTILAVGQIILFALHFILHPWFSTDNVERCQLSNFGLMIVSTLTNAYVLEPRATKVRISSIVIGMSYVQLVCNMLQN